MEARTQSLRQRFRALEQMHPRLRLASLGHRAAMLGQRLQSSTAQSVEKRNLQLNGLARALHSLSPFATLSRGYAIIRDPTNGAVVRDAGQVRVGQLLQARLAAGDIDVQVTKTD